MGLMKWLERLGLLVNNPDDPTKTWVRDPNLEIVLDLDAGTFCGVAFGESVDRLSGLGRCEKFRNCIARWEADDDNEVEIEHSSTDEIRSRDLDYWSDGFSLSTTWNWRFQHLILLNAQEGKSKRYRHGIKYKAASMNLSEESDTALIERGFGEPHRVFKDSDSDFDPPSCIHRQTWEYRLPRALVSFHFNEDRRLAVVAVLPVEGLLGELARES